MAAATATRMTGKPGNFTLLFLAEFMLLSEEKFYIKSVSRGTHSPTRRKFRRERDISDLEIRSPGCIMCPILLGKEAGTQSEMRYGDLQGPRESIVRETSGCRRNRETMAEASRKGPVGEKRLPPSLEHLLWLENLFCEADGPNHPSFCVEARQHPRRRMQVRVYPSLYR